MTCMGCMFHMFSRLWYLGPGAQSVAARNIIRNGCEEDVGACFERGYPWRCSTTLEINSI